MIHCRTNHRVYCFPCLMFEKNDTRYTKSKFCIHKEGFNNWKKLNPKIADHENSPRYKNNFLEWKTPERNLEMNTTIDHELINHIHQEKQKWRYILRSIWDSVLFCAKNNLPLRGHSHMLGDPSSGIFLNVMELISNYDATVANHLSNSAYVKYLSPQIQNKFINLLVIMFEKIS